MYPMHPDLQLARGRMLDRLLRSRRARLALDAGPPPQAPVPDEVATLAAICDEAIRSVPCATRSADVAA